MYELGILRDGGKFAFAPNAPTRLAMVHRSFRTTSLRRGIHRQQFAAHFPALGLLNLAHSLKVDAANGKIHLPEIRYFDEEVYADEDELVESIADWLSPKCFQVDHAARSCDWVGCFSGAKGLPI
jgi:hypothetical protein